MIPVFESFFEVCPFWGSLQNARLFSFLDSFSSIGFKQININSDFTENKKEFTFSLSRFPEYPTTNRQRVHRAVYRAVQERKCRPNPEQQVPSTRSVPSQCRVPRSTCMVRHRNAPDPVFHA